MTLENGNPLQRVEAESDFNNSADTASRCSPSDAAAATSSAACSSSSSSSSTPFLVPNVVDDFFEYEGTRMAAVAEASDMSLASSSGFASFQNEDDDGDGLGSPTEVQVVIALRWLEPIQWILLAITASLLVALQIQFSGDWDRQCDFSLKVWSTVWLVRAVVLIANQLGMTLWRLRRPPLTPPPQVFRYVARGLSPLGVALVLYGFSLLYYDKHCPDATLAFQVSRVLFWLTASAYLLPLALYALLCLCLPCIVYLMVRMSVEPQDRLPTPPEVIRQLETTKYGELLTALRSQFEFNQRPPQQQSQSPQQQAQQRSSPPDQAPSRYDPPESIGTASQSGGDHSAASMGGVAVTSGPVGRVINSMSALFASRTSPPSTAWPDPSTVSLLSPRAADGHADARAPAQFQRACPICIMDFDDADEVMVMPCDRRHFFHASCVDHWLETSQACPICRANIVHVVLGHDVVGARAGSTTVDTPTLAPSRGLANSEQGGQLDETPSTLGIEINSGIAQRNGHPALARDTPQRLDVADFV
eukprot:GHVT01079545.1.p1 GENE.GHVT01079545.1~~GHVT01079545.1.p1  ORF type:complete len:569 (+),score=118.55 GHVT01079545.1:110-1708(+)